MKPLLTPEIYWEELKNYGLLDHFIQDVCDPDIPTSTVWRNSMPITLENLDAMVNECLLVHHNIPHSLLINWASVPPHHSTSYDAFWDYLYDKYEW